MIKIFDMFKIFKKEDFNGNYCPLLSSDGVLAITEKNFIVELSDDNKWEFKNENDYIVVPTSSLTKENLAFQIIHFNSPEHIDAIDVYKVDEFHVVNGGHIASKYYVVHEYNTKNDLDGSYYIVKDIEQLKKDVAKDYSFIVYNSNYMVKL